MSKVIQQSSLLDDLPPEPPQAPPQATQSDVARVSVPQPPPDFRALEGFIGAWGKR
jgi:hypothetical protein